MTESSTLISGRDALLFAIPFIGLVFISLFRLDRVIAAPRESPVRHTRPACGVDEAGEPILCDPDGRRSGASLRNRHSRYGNASPAPKILPPPQRVRARLPVMTRLSEK